MRAWLTPDTIPTLRACQAVSIPDDPAWRAAFRGALLLLCEEENWEQFGTITPAQAAATWWEVFLDQGGCGDRMVGEIVALAYQSSDANLLSCDGSEYAPTAWPQLFTRIGYVFGSGSGDNFRVPDLQGRTVIAVGEGLGLTPRSLGDKVGTEQESLSADQNGQHSHSVHGHLEGLAVAPGELLVNIPSFGTQTGSSGSGDPHNNMQPSLAVHYYIVARGFDVIEPPALFTDLGDTPQSYVGEGGKFVRVNDTETGLEFDTVGAGNGAPVGTILAWPTDAPPDSYLLCYGQAISRVDYGDLFAVIGTIYGAGDGSTTFNLPDLRGRFPLGQDDMGGISANRVTDPQADSPGGAGGAESHQLIADEVPAHNHVEQYSVGGTPNPSYRDGSGPSGANGLKAASLLVQYGSDWLRTQNTGGDQSHNNLPPWLTLNYIIRF